MWLAALAAAVLALSGCNPAVGSATPGPCGFATADWCASPPGDRCDVHKDTASCKADPKCKGMPYQGESVVACMDDGRGFATNCPTVGCVSR